MLRRCQVIVRTSEGSETRDSYVEKRSNIQSAAGPMMIRNQSNASASSVGGTVASNSSAVTPARSYWSTGQTLLYGILY